MLSANRFWQAVENKIIDQVCLCAVVHAPDWKWHRGYANGVRLTQGGRTQTTHFPAVNSAVFSGMTGAPK